tara:strand:- start:3660 stop:4550 length:891 start_codon:yes stop_codon:yes gene_type:complete
MENPLLSLLVAICTVSNLLAIGFFFWEVGLHPQSFNWVPALFTFGMLIVPGLTASRRKRSSYKTFWDTFFVVYGLITFVFCSLAVGLAGDSPWGCGLEKPFDCDMSHPGIWGAFLFGLASVTGHAFGWKKIKVQRTSKGYMMTPQQFEYEMMSTGEIGVYIYYKREKIEEYTIQVVYGFWNIVISCLILLIFTVETFIEDRWQLGILYILALMYQLMKAFYFANDTGYFGCSRKNIRFGTKKSLLWTVINLVLIVWLVGANWFIVGKKIQGEKKLGAPLSSAIFTTIVAVLQHYII